MFHNKAQVSTDTPIVISLFAFQAIILLGLGFLNIDQKQQDVGTNFTYTGFDIINFKNNVISNISELGWGNALIFTPFLIGIGYIVAKLIRGGG